LSNAKGPKTSAFKFSSFANLVISAASIELGTLSKTSSVADKIDIFGLSFLFCVKNLLHFSDMHFSFYIEQYI